MEISPTFRVLYRWETSFLNLPLLRMEQFGDLLDSYDMHQLDSFFDANIDLVDENALLSTELTIATEEIATLKIELAKAQQEIRGLKRRLDACESSILWCGEACFDEMETKGYNFKKAKQEVVIDLTQTE